VASRDCGANRNAGGQGSLRQPLWLADKSLTGSGLSLPEAAASVPGRKSPWWSAERGPVRYGTGRAARLGGRASHARQNKKSALSALHPPLVRGGGADKVPKGKEQPGRKGCGAGTRKDTASEETDA
jgi:hypothetical protein